MESRHTGPLLLLWLAALPGCGGAGDAARDAERAAQSWSATVRTAGEQWVRGEVPGPYLRQVAEAADEALEKQDKALADAALPHERRQELTDRLRDVRQRIGDVRQALGREDRTAVFTAVARMPQPPPADPAGPQ